MGGYILGYLSLTVTLIMTLFAGPAMADAAKSAWKLQQAKEMHAAIESLSKKYDSPPGGFPADIGVASATALRELLLKKGLIDEAAAANFADFEVGNVSESDPPATILLKSRPSESGSYVIFLKDGSGRIIRPNAADPGGLDAPREPAYLSP